MYKRIVALDVGDVWVGVAHSDYLQMTAIPYASWKFNEFESQFRSYLLLNKVDFVLVGLPKTLQGNYSEQTEKVISWSNNIRKIFSNIEFQFQDERLTSRFAKKIISENKNKKNSDHAVAASIILENFLLYYKKE